MDLFHSQITQPQVDFFYEKPDSINSIQPKKTAQSMAVDPLGLRLLSPILKPEIARPWPKEMAIFVWARTMRLSSS